MSQQQEPIYKSTSGQQEILALYDRAISSRDHCFEQIDVDTRHGRTHVISTGVKSAPPLVLLHGSGSNSIIWLADMEQLSGHFRIHAVDILGEPGKSDPIRLPWKGESHLEWLDDVLRGLVVERTLLGGISLGGWLSAKFAIARPERVERLALICPSAICPMKLSFFPRMFFWSLFGRAGKERIKRIIFNGPPPSEEAGLFFDLMNKHYRYRMGMPPVFTNEELKRLDMPMMLLGGTRDAMVNTIKGARNLKRVLPHAEIELFEDKGHGLINLAEVMLPFLSPAPV